MGRGLGAKVDKVAGKVGGDERFGCRLMVSGTSIRGRQPDGADQMDADGEW